MTTLHVKSSIRYLLLILLSTSIIGQTLASVKAPNFTLTDIDGSTFSLSACSAKVVLIDFFATWCSPCRDAIPALRELYNDYPREQLEIVSISPEDIDDLAVFARTPQINMTWIVVSDPTGNVFDSYLGGDTRIPHMFVIENTDGYIAYDHLGWRGSEDELELRSEINEILSGNFDPGDTDQPGWPFSTIVIIVVIIISLFVIGLIATGSILGWASSPKRRSKKHSRKTKIYLCAKG